MVWCGGVVATWLSQRSRVWYLRWLGRGGREQEELLWLPGRRSSAVVGEPPPPTTNRPGGEAATMVAMARVTRMLMARVARMVVVIVNMGNILHNAT